MPFVAPDPHKFVGKAVGTGQCVAFVQQSAGAPLTKYWRRGELAREAAHAATGIAIATFSAGGHYENRTDGASHAAILIACKENGLLCLDQWKGRAVKERLIRFKGGAGPAVDDGDRYYIIETHS